MRSGNRDQNRSNFEDQSNRSSSRSYRSRDFDNSRDSWQGQDSNRSMDHGSSQHHEDHNNQGPSGYGADSFNQDSTSSRHQRSSSPQGRSGMGSSMGYGGSSQNFGSGDSDSQRHFWNPAESSNSRHHQGEQTNHDRSSYGSAFQGSDYGSASLEGRTGSFNRSQSQGAHSGKGPKGYTRSDDRIKEEICEFLTHDPTIDASNIEVEVASGVVTLTGDVPERRMKHLAEDIVDRSHGVKDVTNNLRVARHEAMGSMSEGSSSSMSNSARTSGTSATSNIGTSPNSATAKKDSKSGSGSMQ